MKIGVNIIGLFPGKNGGAEQYIRNIIASLNKNSETDVYLFLNHEALPTFAENPRLHLYPVNLGINQDVELLNYISTLNIDIWFCPLFHLIPHDCPIPSVVAVFDIQQEYFPQYFSKNELKLRREETAYTMENADVILTISEFSKNTIMEKYGVRPDRIKVTYLDADLCFNEPVNENTAKAVAEEMPRNYIFYPANSWPHKNHLSLLKAYKILKDKYHVDFKLVFSGDQKQEKKGIEKYIIKNCLRDDVIYLGYVDQKKMPYIYRNAKMVVFPSLFEGFGIPLVEAMKSGVPLVCSDRASIPEIAGDAAVYFDPENIEDIVAKIFLLYTDENLRENLKMKSIERKKIFSWEKCALDTFEALKGLYQTMLFDKENTHPLVSIITPSFNQGAFIRETIESVLKQNYSPIEYIVMDGGSTDETVDILKEYGDKIYWRSEKDEGQADAVNKGLSVAKGEIIGWLNSDDTYCDGAIERVVNFFKTHKNIDMVYGEGYYIDKNSEITDRYLTEPYGKTRLAETCIICQPAAFFRKSFVEQVGGLDKDLQLCMDYDLWMNMAQHGRIAYIPDYLASSRMYDENKTMSRRDEVYEEVCRTVKKYYNYVPHTWLIGYSQHLCGGKRSVFFYIRFLQLFIQYNHDNIGYCKTFTKKVIKRFAFKRENYTEMERYPDGWLGRIYHTQSHVKNTANKITISGVHFLPFKEGLKITIEIDDTVIGCFKLTQPGTFIKTIEISPSISSGLHKITFKMSDIMTPKEGKISKDKRKLSFKLESYYLS